MLPNEILIKVFEMLDQKSLMKVAMTCRRFYELVTTIPQLNAELELRLNYNKRVQAQAIADSLRDFEKVKVVGLSGNMQCRSFNLLSQNFAGNIRQFKIVKCSLNFNRLKNIFKRMPLLESVVCSSKFLYEDLNEQNLKNLPSFDHLVELETDTIDVFSNATKLHTLITNQISDSFLPTLWKQTHLKDLTVEYIEENLVTNFPSPMPFQLRILSISNLDEIEHNDQFPRLLSNFLQAQPSLVKLSITTDSALENLLIEQILRMPNLTYLELTVKLKIIFENLQIVENTSKVQCMVLRFDTANDLTPDDHGWNIERMEQFVPLFPKLKNITIDFMRMNQEHFVAHGEKLQLKNLPMLENVQVFLGDQNVIRAALKIHKLNSLTVCGSRFTFKEWHQLADNNPNIASFRTFEIDGVNDDLTFLTTVFKNLETLRIHESAKHKLDDKFLTTLNWKEFIEKDKCCRLYRRSAIYNFIL